jgi:hypothetical protein
LTGKFAAVGSEIEHAAEEKAAKDAATPAEVAKRTVAVVRADVVN